MFDYTTRRLRSKSARTTLYLEYDGKCAYCGENLLPSWHSDHFLPWCKGGKTVHANMRPACRACNLKKGSKMVIPAKNEIYEASFYENLDYFDKDFPNASSVRTCQKGAYNAAIYRLCYELMNSCSIFNPTGTGKSDTIRAIALGLIAKRKKFAGMWIFSPSSDLRKQIKEDGINEFFKRIGETPLANPCMEEDSLDNSRFRNGCFMESYTTQFLTSGNNVDHFVAHAHRLYQKTGKYPVAMFDECHLFSNDKQWGKAAIQLQKAGVPIIVVTGTPFRSDNTQIPGFYLDEEDVFVKDFVKSTRSTKNPSAAKVTRGKEKVSRSRLRADYAYPYQRAWDDDVILKPEPKFVDATEMTYESLLSEMSQGESGRLLRTFLLDERTIQSCVREGVKSLALRKKADPTCAAIVTTLSDSDGGEIIEEDAWADIHAKKIEQEFKLQAPHLRTLVVTSKTNSIDGLKRFKRGSYDVLIVKAMGTVGFNYPPIKTVINLSNYRTLGAFIQLANRGCRKYADIAHFDVIMPKDKSMVTLWNDFLDETGLVIETKETIGDVTETETEVKEKDSRDSSFVFDKHSVTFNPNSKRCRADEIIEMINRKIPKIGNTWSIQEKLSIFQQIANASSEDWLEKMAEPQDVVSDIVDLNEEERRLCLKSRNLVEEITKHIIDLVGTGYSSNLFGNITRNVWTCIKKLCGFHPNQSLKNLSGINNYQKLIDKAILLKQDIVRQTPVDGFDYRSYLSKFRD